MATVSLLLFLAFAATNWYAAAKNRKTVEYVAKPAALAFLLCFAATGHASPWLLAALALSLLGDVYMMLPGDYLIPGLVAFLLGHVAYILDIQATPEHRLLWFGMVAVAASPVAIRIVRSVPALGLKLGVVAYVCAIALMSGSAIASGSHLAAVGAVLFLISDSILAWDLFVKKIPHGHLLVMVTYHLAQLALVIALR